MRDDTYRFMDDPSAVMIVGLGNPGREYAGSRHNIGFRVVEALARAHGLAFARRRGMHAIVAEGMACGSRVILVKPQRYMNLSGKVVGSQSRLFRMQPERTLVVYDDLDLPLGRLRLRPDGSSGGHRGMLSIIEALGTQAFPRLRVGIDRPPGKMDPAEYVLLPFDAQDQPLVAEAVQTAVAAIECWLKGGMVEAMERFNRTGGRASAHCREDQA